MAFFDGTITGVALDLYFEDFDDEMQWELDGELAGALDEGEKEVSFSVYIRALI